jgi:hypothetical protein
LPGRRAATLAAGDDASTGFAVGAPMTAGTPPQGVALSEEIAALFDARDLADSLALTIELVTVDPGGWPRVALLSTGQVVAVGASRLRLALWSGSHSTANLTRTGLATLAFVHDRAAFRVRLRTCRGADLDLDRRLAVFDGRVVDVRKDVVPYAVIECGIRFTLLDEASVLARWKSTVEAIRAHAGCQPEAD